MPMVVEVLNAKPLSNNSSRDRAMLKHGIGNINDYTERLCNFCEENNMAIGGTVFQYKDIQ